MFNLTQRNEHGTLSAALLRAQTAHQQSCANAEFFKICWRVGLGFAVLGFVGFFVKMIFIVRAHHAACLHALRSSQSFTSLVPQHALCTLDQQASWHSDTLLSSTVLDMRGITYTHADACDCALQPINQIIIGG